MIEYIHAAAYIFVWFYLFPFACFSFETRKKIGKICLYKKKEKRKGLRPLGRLFFNLAQPHHVAQQPRPAAVPAPADMWGSWVGPTRPGASSTSIPFGWGERRRTGFRAHAPQRSPSTFK